MHPFVILEFIAYQFYDYQSNKRLVFYGAMISTQAKFPVFINETLSPDEWDQQIADHKKEIGSLIDDYLERRQHQQKDPVLDFLFEYYAFRPSHLKTWSPGFGRLLIDGANHQWNFDQMKIREGNAYLDIKQFRKDRISSLRWIINVLEQSAEQKPSFGCFGMHEWAMVYKKSQNQVRHSQIPLRMDEQQLAEFVESRPLVCTHFDAFRFFSEAAKPQNKFELNRQKFAEMEQPGCLHTNMDLYKWAFKMYPWISSNLIRKAFKLAIKTRYIDMKASPYDLSERGLEPIKIETDAGRKEYIRRQQAIFEHSQPIRRRLIEEYQLLLENLC